MADWSVARTNAGQLDVPQCGLPDVYVKMQLKGGGVKALVLHVEQSKTARIVISQIGKGKG